jgi:hypothetical protein
MISIKYKLGLRTVSQTAISYFRKKSIKKLMKKQIKKLDKNISTSLGIFFLL